MIRKFPELRMDVKDSPDPFKKSSLGVKRDAAVEIFSF
jgi:hypothetical protein